MVPSNSRSYLQGEQCLNLEGSLFCLFDAKEFRLVQICGLNAIVQVDDLEEVSNYYQNIGYFDELSMFVDSGLDLECAHMGLFTKLGTLYVRYHPESLIEHFKLFVTCINTPMLIPIYDEQQHWQEFTNLYIQYGEYDTTRTTMLYHSPEAWEHMQFIDVIIKVINVELSYKTTHFYVEEHHGLIKALFNVLAARIGHNCVVHDAQC